MTVQLPHTGMWVPTARITVTAVHESDDQDTGTVRVAIVHYDQTLLGYAVTAQDDPTRFVPEGPSSAAVMDSFLNLAHFTDVAQPPPAQVLDYLIGEYEWTRVVRAIQARRWYALRLIGPDSLPLRAEAIELSGPYPRYRTARHVLSRRVFPPEAARVDLWVGQRWTQIYPDPNK